MSVEHSEQAADETITPLVNWAKPPSLADLKKDLLEAQPDHQAQVTRINTWLDNLNVEGQAKANAPKGRSQVQPKLIRKQAEWRYPALSEPFLSTDELFKVKPVSWEDKKAAQQNALVLNNQFNTKINRVDFIDEFVRTVVDEGTAIVRVGWEFEEAIFLEDAPIVQLIPDPAMQPLMEELTAMAQQNPTAYKHDVPMELQQAHAASIEDGVPYRPQITGTSEIEVTRTVVNRPTLEVCDYRNVIIDPSCKGKLEKAGFIIHSFPSSRAKLEKEKGRYHNLDKIDVENNSVLGDPDHANETASNFNFSDKARKQFVVYEYWGYWDIDGSGALKPIVAAWVGDVLIRLEESPFPDKKLPFVRVQYLPKRRSTYGEPDGELLEDNQKIVGAVTRGMIDLMGKSANAQTGTRKGALDVTNRRKFDTGQDYEFNANIPPDQAFYQHKYPEIPVSAQFMVESQYMDAESLTGVKAFASTGMSGTALGDTATGIRGALDAASKRELAILRRLANGMVEIGRKIISMNAVFLDEEEVVRVTNEEFVPVRRDDLAGNFDLSLTISTAEEDAAKAGELAFMLQTLGPNEDPKIRRIVLADIARLRKMPDLAKRFEEYEPQPDPMQQQLQMMQIELLRAQILETLSKVQGNEAGAQLDIAKAHESIAKAANLQSAADLNNLNFVEQETGVTQARELEQAGAQARANMHLKVLDHSLKKDLEEFKELKAYKKSR